MCQGSVDCLQSIDSKLQAILDIIIYWDNFFTGNTDPLIGLAISLLFVSGISSGLR